MDQTTKMADVPARVLMATIFILSGMGKTGAFSATQSYMESFGLPGILLGPTIALELTGGLFLVLGLWTRYVALILAGFSLISALIFHSDFGNQAQMMHFLKNLAMAGGFLLLVKHGSPTLSLDGYLASRKKT